MPVVLGVGGWELPSTQISGSMVGQQAPHAPQSIFWANIRGIIPFDKVQTFLHQMTRYLNGSDYIVGMDIEDLGDNHWTVRFIRTMGFLFGTALPRSVPLGEAALFHWNTFQVRRGLRKRGTPIGHGAGSGADVSAQVHSRL